MAGIEQGAPAADVAKMDPRYAVVNVAARDGALDVDEILRRSSEPG